MSDTIANSIPGQLLKPRRADKFLTKIPTVTIFPSGDISLGYAPNPEYSPNTDTEEIPEDFYATDYQGMIDTIDQDVQAWGDFALALEAEGRTEQAFTAYEAFTSKVEAASGLSDALNSHKDRSITAKPTETKERAPRGSNGISPFGKRSLKSVGAILGKEYSRELMTFTTCTIPGFDQEELQIVCDSWPELTRQFQQELRRELKRKGLPLDYFGCSEVQPKRWEKRGEIAPHLHFCFIGRRTRYQPWQINHEWVTSTWERLLSNLLKREVDGSAACETRGVKKSVAHEIGKYLSKGGEVIHSIRQAGRGSELPKAYWNVPNHLRKEVKALTHKFRGGMADVIHDAWKGLSDLGLASLREIWVEIPGQKNSNPHKFLAGFTGWISGDVLAEIESGDIWSLYITSALIGR